MGDQFESESRQPFEEIHCAVQFVLTKLCAALCTYWCQYNGVDSAEELIKFTSLRNRLSRHIAEMLSDDTLLDSLNPIVSRFIIDLRSFEQVIFKILTCENEVIKILIKKMADRALFITNGRDTIHHIMQLSKEFEEILQEVNKAYGYSYLE
jgi:hypothetical protein